MSSNHMEGEALVWYQDAVDCGAFNGWGTFLKALHPTKALTSLKQTALVTSYKAQFEVMSNKLKWLYDRHKLSFFSGLRDEIWLPVTMQHLDWPRSRRNICEKQRSHGGME